MEQQIPGSGNNQAMPPDECEGAVDIEQLSTSMLGQAVRVHLEAFEGYTNAMFGGRYVHAFLKYFHDEKDAIALAALLDGELVGYAVGAPIGYAHPLLWRVLPSALVGALAHPQLLLDAQVQQAVRRKLAALATRRLMRQNNAGSPETTSLVGIGTARKARRRGVGSRLLHAFEAEARDRGATQLRLTVYNDNAAARALYENCGWTSETRPHENSTAFLKRLQVSPRAAA